MIVAQRKHIQEIKNMLARHRRILVLGCGGCVTVCLAGGEREVGLIASALRIAYRIAPDSVIPNECEESAFSEPPKSRFLDCARNDVDNADATEHEIRELTIERQCENQFMEDILGEVSGVDAVLSLACGAGVQAMAERYPDTPVYPGLDTKFIGVLEQQGVWAEKCAACGRCVLGEYGAVCPVTRCSKSLTSGPCGASRNGKCEVSPEIDCGWKLIYDRLKTLGQLEHILDPTPLPDWSEGACRRIVREDQRIKSR